MMVSLLMGKRVKMNQMVDLKVHRNHMFFDSNA